MNIIAITRKNYFAVYSLIWAAVIIIQALILYFLYGFDATLCLADSFVFNVLFALAGYTLWFVIRYNLKNKTPGIETIWQHLLVAIIIIATWFTISYYTLNGLFKNNEDYLLFLNKSTPWRIINGIFYYIVLVLIYYLILYYEDIQEKLKRETELQNLVKEAELDALKSQINPHFLFNSLNSVSSLTMMSPEKAQEMVIKLSNFLRYSLSGDRRSKTTLENEFNNLKRYLDIEKVRFGDRLRFIAEIPDACTDARIPSLILQPLIENAIKHGVYNSSEQVTIRLKCSRTEDFIIIEISNDYDPEAIRKKGEGIGLKNIRNRLKLIYQRGDLLHTGSNGKIFKAVLKIPQH